MPTAVFNKAFQTLADANRRRLLGSPTLMLLDHAPMGRQGYVGLAPFLTDHWQLIDGAIGEPASLQILEGPSADATVIGRAVAFSINGLVWKIEENSISAPLGTSKRLWKFQVRPTGEPAVNKPPIVSAGPDFSVDLAAGNSFDLQGSAFDDQMPPHELTYQWIQLTGPASVVFSDAADPLSSVTFSAIGSYILRLRVDDGFQQGLDDVTATVIHTNQAPTVSFNFFDKPWDNADGPLHIEDVTDVIVADDGLPDPPGALTYAWSLTSAPIGGSAGFAPSDAITTDITFSDIDGDYVVRLTADDSALQGFREVTIHVTAAPGGAFSLEDGSGRLALEDGSGVLSLE